MNDLRIRLDVNQLRDDRREEMMAWVESLGVQPRDVRPVILIAEGDIGYELHLSRFLRTESGHMRIDRAADHAVTEPLIVGLGTSKSWPAWLERA